MSGRDYRVYKALGDGDGGHLVKCSAWLPDRPGSLSGLASAFSARGMNIVLFHYNRSEHPNRTVVEAVCGGEREAWALRDDLTRMGYIEAGATETTEPLGVVDAESMLSMEIELRHEPGTLAALAGLFREHGANVTMMSYNETVSVNSALISLFTHDAPEVERLVRDLNERGYHYSVKYRGIGQREIDDVIGLNLSERFYFRLRALTGASDVEYLRGLVSSSSALTAALNSFSREAGRHYEAGGLFTEVLAFASASLMRTGERFQYRKLAPIVRAGIAFHMFRLPTGANIIYAASGEGVILFETGYGLYFEDIRRMLAIEGLPPERITDVYITHADADHAGGALMFRERLGCRVHMHPAAAGVIKYRDRSHGTASPVAELNRHFTSIVDELTGARYPLDWVAFNAHRKGEFGGFPVIDGFEFGGVGFSVIESLGGHTPGQVFFLSMDAGIIITGDYLLDVATLDADEKRVLNYAKNMMTTTNVDSALFRAEMTRLDALASELAAALPPGARPLVIAPGHGAYHMRGEGLSQSRG